MHMFPLARTLRAALDFALPPRCPGCGAIVADVHLFCSRCWSEIEFLAGNCCGGCGLPLLATESENCAVCLARPPQLDRVRAAVAYGKISRRLALRLKYGRKTAIAETMARNMERLLEPMTPGAVLIPVPLHRSRLWSRGFNQAMLVAQALARRKGLAVAPRLLRRRRRTPSLRGLNARQRLRAVADAFAVADGSDLGGRTFVLVDDVYTTGSTANACARALKRRGAARVELIAWARVIRPANFW